MEPSAQFLLPALRSHWRVSAVSCADTCCRHCWDENAVPRPTHLQIHRATNTGSLHLIPECFLRPDPTPGKSRCSPTVCVATYTSKYQMVFNTVDLADYQENLLSRKLLQSLLRHHCILNKGAYQRRDRAANMLRYVWGGDCGEHGWRWQQHWQRRRDTKRPQNSVGCKKEKNLHYFLLVVPLHVANFSFSKWIKWDKAMNLREVSTVASKWTASRKKAYQRSISVMLQIGKSPWPLIKKAFFLYLCLDWSGHLTARLLPLFSPSHPIQKKKKKKIILR